MKLLSELHALVEDAQDEVTRYLADYDSHGEDGAIDHSHLDDLNEQLRFARDTYQRAVQATGG